MAEDRVAGGQVSGEAAPTQMKPPLPKPLYRVVNPTMAALLRSPLHRLLSNAMMLLSFQGRGTGKRYTIPVGYLRQGNRLFLFCHSGWWKNFRGGAPVAVRLRGQMVRGTAKIIEDPETIAQVVRLMVERRGEKMARRMGVLNDAPGSPTGTVFIEITLEEPR